MSSQDIPSETSSHDTVSGPIARTSVSDQIFLEVTQETAEGPGKGSNPAILQQQNGDSQAHVKEKPANDKENDVLLSSSNEDKNQEKESERGDLPSRLQLRSLVFPLKE